MGFGRERASEREWESERRYSISESKQSVIKRKYSVIKRKYSVRVGEREKIFCQ